MGRPNGVHGDDVSSGAPAGSIDLGVVKSERDGCNAGWCQSVEANMELALGDYRGVGPS